MYLRGFFWKSAVSESKRCSRARRASSLAKGVRATLVSRSWIVPVVGRVHRPFELVANPHEVDQVFEVPLAYLMNPAHHRRHAFEAEGLRREWFSMPYLDQGVERYIWGATAGMLRNFYRFLSA